MHAGHYISGAGHLGLIGWLMLGGLFAAQPEPLDVTEVSVISGADFEAMLSASEPPQSVSEVAQPAAPETADPLPEFESAADAPQEQVLPVPIAPPDVEAAPDVPERAPDLAEVPPDLSEPVGDLAVLAPEVAPDAAPRPVERVAPEPVAQPEPEATPDPETQEAAAPEPSEAPAPDDTQDATAPEEAVSEIVTEATQAPAASQRPPGRRPAAPAREVAEATPAERVETETPSQPSDPVNNDDVLAALQAAQDNPAPPSGPPLSSGEREALRVAVAQCWNVGSLSSEAMQTTVVVAVQMNQDATPVTSSIRMMSATGGSDAAARRVFDSARRAIILCGARGLNLPVDATECVISYRKFVFTAF